jgi:hypothetical protein
MTKKEIKVKVGDPRISTYRHTDNKYVEIINTETVWVETGIFDLSIRLQELYTEYGNNYKNLEIDGVKDCNCYESSCGCSPTYYLIGTRLESDLEYKFRLDLERKRAEAIEARDRVEFEKLKAKFGKDK